MATVVGAPIETKKVAIHVIKTFPPCHLNGDENGNQKICYFGGVPRIRVSGSNIGHSVRTSDLLKDFMPIGTRSRMLPSEVLQKMSQIRDENKEFADIDEEFIQEAARKLTKIGKSGKESDKEDDEGSKKKTGKKEEQLITKQTVFYTKEDVDELANILLAEALKANSFEDFKKITLDMRKIPALRRIYEGPISIDMALFGVMTTAEFMQNVESAVQIGQAISTHTLHRETDFFSCTDDLIESGDAVGISGAALTDTFDFSCPCMYQYAAIDMGILNENMENVLNGKGKTAEAAITFIKAFALECSKTKQSRFASAVLPDMIMVEVFDDNMPIYSYAGAFKNPVKTFGDHPEVTKNSVKAFSDFTDKQNQFLERKVRRAFVSMEFKDECPESAEVYTGLDSLLQTVKKWIEE